MLSFFLRLILPFSIAFGGGVYAAHRWDAGTIADLKRADALVAAHQAEAALALQKAQDAVTLAAALKEASAQARVRLVTHTIIEKVPLYVTSKADAACIVPDGFVRLFDAAASGAVPGPARESDDAASGVALSRVAELSVEHDGQYHAVAEQLTALQNWVRAVSGARPSSAH